MFFLTPRYVKQARALAKDAKKLLAYKRDLWSDAVVAEFEGGIKKLEEATKARDEKRIEEVAKELDALAGKHVPQVPDAGWRENVEVFLVAIVIALGVRTYFLQPFTIPTGSMQPTLNGIIVHATSQPPPNFARKMVDHLFGRSWYNVVADEDETLVDFEQRKGFKISRHGNGFLTYTAVLTDKNTYYVDETADAARQMLQGRSFRKGDPIIRGYVDAGDHVFVDKVTYHFRKPRREEVIVFSTQGIPTLDNRNRPKGWPSQFYIKRLAGLPGDALRIDPPQLYINGEVAKGEKFQRVMSAKDGYNGYGNGDARFLRDIMRSPDAPYTVPEKHYFAMGDNSYHSSDSRDWGPVPERNLMGRGLFVYWPFGKHWGLIR